MNKDLTKEEIIQDIKQRILDEHRKHSKLMDDPTIWAEIAARKIYSGYILETCECGRELIVTKYCPVCDNDN